MARLHQAQLKTFIGKLNADNNVQRNSRASDRHAFDSALKLAKSEKPEKIDNTSVSLNSSALVFNSDEQEDWYRYTQNSVTSTGEFQSAQFVDTNQANAESDLGSDTYLVRDFNCNDNDDSAINTKRLDEVSDWLDEMLDQGDKQAGSWTFEFETNDAQLVELRLFCREDGQWSACMNLDTALDDQQRLEVLLSKKGVALSWTDFS